MIRIVITGMREQEAPMVIETEAFVLSAQGAGTATQRGTECVIQGPDDVVASCLSSAIMAARRAYGPGMIGLVTLGVLNHSGHEVRASKVWAEPK